MTAFILILAFPLIGGLGYALFHFVGRLLRAGRRPGALERYNMLVYAFLLLIPLVAVLLAVVPAASEVGVRWPVLAGLSAGLAVPVWVLVGVAAGVVAYRVEVLASRPRLPASGQQADLRYLADGETEAFVARAQQLPIALLLGATVLIVCVEEVLWRGYLITYAMGSFSLPWWVALLLSAAAFGVNHYYFGLRNVASKFVLGGVWGGLFLLTGSVLVPIASHLSYNALALNLKIEIER